jgi:3-deoxy-D-manno-octulosonic-acid transferase
MWMLSPLWHYILRQRLKRGKETQDSITQKIGLRLPVRPVGQVIWGHAVGVGEALALAGLFAQLAKRLPTHHFLISSSAKTSAQALANGQLPPRCQHQFAPIDTPKALHRFLTHWHPSLFIACELDLWPGLIGKTRTLGIPLFLVNARLSPDSVRNKQRWRLLYQAVLNCFDTIYCQNIATQQGFLRLGISPSRLAVNGSVKALAEPLAFDAHLFDQLKVHLNQRPCWLAASTHEGEEHIAINAHVLIRQTVPDALLIIAPRYPKRGNDLAQHYDLKHAQRSQGAMPNKNTCIYLADTIGEMGIWYSLSQIALIGGSLVTVGGHNPYEALHLNCAVLHGPHIHNFQESYEELSKQRLVQAVNTAQDLAQTVIHAFKQTDSHSQNNIEQSRNAVFEPMITDICRTILHKNCNNSQ